MSSSFQLNTNHILKNAGNQIVDGSMEINTMNECSSKHHLLTEVNDVMTIFIFG